MRLACVGLLLFLGTLAPAQASGPSRKADRFGLTELHPTKKGGREWFARWDEPRTVPRYKVDPLDPACRNSSDRPLVIGGGIARISAGASRIFILTPAGGALPPWRNVEMTVQVKRGKRASEVDYQAFDLSARSGLHHNDSDPCDGTSYHATLRFDGKAGFKKEVWHTGGYTGLAPARAPRPWPTVPEGRWIGMKALCRNQGGDKAVRLQLYLDPEARDEWTQVAEFIDAGGWNGGRARCDRPRDYVITEARAAVYFRTDFVDAEVRKFSVREVDPLP